MALVYSLSMVVLYLKCNLIYNYSPTNDFKKQMNAKIIKRELITLLPKALLDYVLNSRLLQTCQNVIAHRKGLISF